MKPPTLIEPSELAPQATNRQNESQPNKIAMKTLNPDNPINPFFPALRSGYRLFHRPSPQKQIPSNNPRPTIPMKTASTYQRTACPILAAIPTTGQAGLKKPRPGKFRWLKPLAILCSLVNAAAADTFGLFTYTDNGTTITITDYPTKEVGAVEIPARIRLLAANLSPASGTTRSRLHRTDHVTIPDGVTSIGDLRSPVAPA